jgi:hypothetical protein
MVSSESVKLWSKGGANVMFFTDVFLSNISYNKPEARSQKPEARSQKPEARIII